MKAVHQSIKKLYKDQDGISMVLVAISMLMIIGLSAIVVDAGSLYVEKSRLQKALDAAVLAGAQMLPMDKELADDVAIQVADKNGITLLPSDYIDVGDDYIEIKKTTSKDLTFAKVFGINKADVYATAKAKVQTFQGGTGVIPVGVLPLEYENNKDKDYTLTLEKSENGNFGFLRIGGNGASVLESNIKNGITINLGLVDTEPGLNWGKVNDSFEYRINKDHSQGKTECVNVESAKTSDCSRVVTVPIVDSFSESKGTSVDVNIIGFAAFWIKDVLHNNDDKEKKIIGRFIDYKRDGSYGPGTNYGITRVKLVN